MFTGIIEEVGAVAGLQGRRLTVSSGLDGLGLGDSIAVNGVCLTVVDIDPGGHRGFAAELSEETLARTSLAQLREASPVNLERPVVAGGRLGGHVVQGHVDGVGQVTARVAREGSVEMWFQPPPGLARYLVEKGSVAVDGVSLTVATKEGATFSVALIPHTLGATSLGQVRPGDAVNIEVDILAKYVEGLLAGKEAG